MKSNRERNRESLESVPPEGWSARRSREKTSEKEAIAAYFAEHEFLVAPNSKPEDPRETAATILVVHGTSPDIAVGACLNAIASRQRPYGPFINWYSPGALVPTTLLHFRREYPDLISATKMFLFPGEVDLDIEAACSDEAVAYAKSLDITFTYVFLGAYSCDLQEGVVYFQHPREVNLQRACALKQARQKLLFLDSTKFRREGQKGYTFPELLATSENVTLYTVSKSEERSTQILEEFRNLADASLVRREGLDVDRPAGEKNLSLCMLGRAGRPPVAEQVTGYLKRRPSDCDEQRGTHFASEEMSHHALARATVASPTLSPPPAVNNGHRAPEGQHATLRAGSNNATIVSSHADQRAE